MLFDGCEVPHTPVAFIVSETRYPEYRMEFDSSTLTSAVLSRVDHPMQR